MKFLADYRLDSDLCLPDGAPQLIFRSANGSFSLTICNSKDNRIDTAGVLVGWLEFEAESLEVAEDRAEANLAEALNALAFTTSRDFSRNRLRAILDWTPGPALRNAFFYHEGPLWAEAEAVLCQEFIETAEFFASRSHDERLQSALRWYRLALKATLIEEQFSYFWFALEIAAEALKDKVKVPSRCPHCNGALYCEICRTHPMHKKFPGQAIRALVEKYAPDLPEAFATLQTIRHALMHGDRISSVIEDLPCSDGEAVNALQRITRDAVADFIGLADAPLLNLGHVEDITRRKLKVTAHVSIGMLGSPDNLKPENIPDLKVSMVSVGASDAMPRAID